MAGYFEKLRDPRWQRKRLEIMQRDGFRCCCCGDSESTLNVHHGFYDGRDPWEYEDDTLWTLCEPCHAGVKELIRDAQYEVAQFSPDALSVLAPILHDLKQCSPNVLCRLAELVNDLVADLCQKKISSVPEKRGDLCHVPNN